MLTHLIRGILGTHIVSEAFYLYLLSFLGHLHFKFIYLSSRLHSASHIGS